MKKSKPWTKRELSLRPGPVELARAVIQQWLNDGSPAYDKEAIIYWLNLIREYDKEKERCESKQVNLESLTTNM